LPISDPQNVTTLYQPPYSPDLSPPDYFLFPKLKMKLKELHFTDVAEIQVTVTDELKKIKNSNFWQLFRNCTTTQKPVYMPVELILNLKWNVSSIFQKISPKTFGLHCVCKFNTSSFLGSSWHLTSSSLKC
jgi:hypothetical protein